MLEFYISPDPGDFENPAETLNQFAAVINVSDSPLFLFKSPVPYYFFPVFEISEWGYEPFYGAVKVCDFYLTGDPDCKQDLKLNKPAKILFHCHAGINRSVSVCEAMRRTFLEKGINIPIQRVAYKGNYYETNLKNMSNTFQKNIDKDYFKQLMQDRLIKCGQKNFEKREMCY